MANPPASTLTPPPRIKLMSAVGTPRLPLVPNPIAGPPNRYGDTEPDVSPNSWYLARTGSLK